MINSLHQTSILRVEDELQRRADKFRRQDVYAGTRSSLETEKVNEKVSENEVKNEEKENKNNDVSNSNSNNLSSDLGLNLEKSNNLSSNRTERSHSDPLSANGSGSASNNLEISEKEKKENSNNDRIKIWISIVKQWKPITNDNNNESNSDENGYSCDICMHFYVFSAFFDIFCFFAFYLGGFYGILFFFFFCVLLDFFVRFSVN